MKRTSLYDDTKYSRQNECQSAIAMHYDECDADYVEEREFYYFHSKKSRFWGEIQELCRRVNIKYPVVCHNDEVLGIRVVRIIDGITYEPIAYRDELGLWEILVDDTPTCKQCEAF